MNPSEANLHRGQVAHFTTQGLQM